MSNDSTVAGFLTPTGDAPAYDAQMNVQIIRWVTGLTGLPEALIFTASAQTPPDSASTWCEFEIEMVEADVCALHIQHREESASQRVQETVTVMLRFCGTAGLGTAAQLRDGVKVNQNNAALNAEGFTFHRASPIVFEPLLINTQWLRRYELHVTLIREITRDYAIKMLVDAPVSFLGE